MSFGLAGRKSTCSLCKNAKNGKTKEETSKYQNNVSRNHGPMARIIDINSDKK